ncbi:MAG: AraC family transcriptional regulator [Lachnospiraceae bacterium]|nr:AraC family transcriptional regulator [Lachnospiraceae bacterium]
MDNYKITKETMDMINTLNSPASSINVRNSESDFSRFYHMDVPFQLTLEYCSGSEPDDYINIVTLAPDRSILYQESFSTKNYAHIRDILHFHDYFEFVSVLKGVIIQKLEGQNHTYTAGDSCLLNRSLCHLEHYHSPAVVLFVGLSPDFLTQLFTYAKNSSFQNEKKISDSDFYRFINSDLKNSGKKAYIDFHPTHENSQNAEQLHMLADSMVRTLLYPGFGAAHQIRGLICNFIENLFSPVLYHHTLTELDTDSDFLIFTSISLLFEKSAGRMTRAELEQTLSYSSDYLNRIVNKYAGMCLFDYSMTFRLKKAAKYLVESKDSISAIAAKLQFSNRTHFYALFKEKYGVTPKEYRKMHL